jgi:hypothetical protein
VAEALCLRRAPSREGRWDLGIQIAALLALRPYIRSVALRSPAFGGGGSWLLLMGVVYIGPEIVVRATGRFPPSG